MQKEFDQFTLNQNGECWHCRHSRECSDIWYGVIEGTMPEVNNGQCSKFEEE